MENIFTVLRTTDMPNPLEQSRGGRRPEGHREQCGMRAGCQQNPPGSATGSSRRPAEIPAVGSRFPPGPVRRLSVSGRLPTGGFSSLRGGPGETKRQARILVCVEVESVHVLCLSCISC